MPKHWHSIGPVNLALTSTSTAIGGSLALDGPWTVLRMLGEFLLNFDPEGTIAINDKATITLAVGVVSTDAAAAGAGSVPDPNVEPDYPWLYWSEHFLVALEATPL